MKVTYRGWAGHFCFSQYCKFRLNTLVEEEDTKIVVSTVGLMRINDKWEQIGLDRYYETMAFYAQENDEFDDADVSRPISFESNWCIDRVDAELEAQAMHEAVVEEICEKLKRGEL